MTFWDWIEAGEYVMIALVAIILTCLFFLAVKSIEFHRYKKSYNSLMQQLRDHIGEGDLDNARLLCDSTESPGARILSTGVENIGQHISVVKATMDEDFEVQRHEMRKGIIWLRCFAVVSPLIGFGGTLCGIIHRLQILGEMPETDISILCSALSPTLVTSVAGLIAGVVALISLAAIEESVEKALVEMKNLCQDFINLLNQPS